MTKGMWTPDHHTQLSTFPQICKHTIVNMSLYIIALRFSFTGTMRPKAVLVCLVISFHSQHCLLIVFIVQRKEGSTRNSKYTCVYTTDE